MVTAMIPGRSYCCALSVNVDRFSDAVLRKRWICGLRIEGRPATVASLRAACATMRTQGFEVFPACDAAGPDGSCQGHERAEGGGS